MSPYREARQYPTPGWSERASPPGTLQASVDTTSLYPSAAVSPHRQGALLGHASRPEKGYARTCIVFLDPLFAPKPGEKPGPGGPLSYSMTLSDDGKSAIVEFSARDRKAFAEILNSRRPDVKAFERGKATKEEIENEFRKVKKDFDANTSFRGGK